MSKAHINSDILLANRPVVIDSPSTAYFPFNNTLVSQGYSMYPLVDPVSGNISGASNSIEGALQKYDHSGLIVPGKYSSGVILDEETTNVASNPISIYSGYHSMTRVGQNLTFTMAGTAYAIAISVPALGTLQGRTFSYSGYMKKNGIPFIWISNTINTYNVAADSKLKYFDETTGYFEAVEYFSCPNNWAMHALTTGAVVAGDIVTIEEFQMEEKPYITSFTESTRTNSVLTYPRYPIRTVSCWVKSTSNKVIDSIRVPRTILRQVNFLDSYPQWSLYACNTNTSEVIPGTATPVPAGSAVLMIKWKTNGVDVTTYLCTVPDINILDGGWHHITCEFGLGSICRISVDDKYGDTLSIPETNYNFDGQLRVGYDSTSELSGNFLIDELRLDNHTYSRDDIRRRFISGAEYYNPYSYESTCIT